MTRRVDALISGAGMVGLIAANALARAGMKVTVIDRQALPQWQAGQSPGLRVCAISAQRLQALRDLGIGAHLHADTVRNGSYRCMRVWDNLSDGFIEFNAEDSSHDLLGAIIENQHLISAAHQAALLRGCEIIEHAQITQFEQTDSAVHVHMQGAEPLTARVLIGAEGANSPLRALAGIQARFASHQQCGLVAMLCWPKAPRATALQAFNATGPLGILPLSPGLFSIVWSLPETQVKQWLECDEDQFIEGLMRATGRDLGTPELCSKRAAFPLRSMRVEAFFKGRIVLCGDAAHVIHPLAGQGVNLGIDDALLLARQLQHVDLRNAAVVHRALRVYQRERLSRSVEMSHLMGALNGLFSNDAPPLRWLRGMGLSAVNRMPLLKNWLLQQAGS